MERVELKPCVTSFRSIVAWIAAVLFAVIVISPALTSFGSVASIMGGMRQEIATTPIQSAGYMVRELSYLILALLGVLSIKSKRHLLLLYATALLISSILIKDVVIYGSLNWAAYGIRPLIIALSVFSFIIIIRWNCMRQLEFINFIIKLILLILIPVTIYQIGTIPPVFGATFLGPRTLGFWSNPIIYSMALASFGLYLLISRARHAWAWLVLCGVLALTTGGRSGLLAIAFMFLAHVAPWRLFSKMPQKTRLLVYLFAPAIALAAMVGLMSLVSKPEISGRPDTELMTLGNSRFGVLISGVNQLASDSVVGILIGRRLGDGTNAVQRYDDQNAISDNFFLMVLRNYGFAGMLIFLYAIVAWLQRPNVDMVIISLCAFSFMMAQSFLEIHPVSILTLAAAAIARFKGDKSDSGTS